MIEYDSSPFEPAGKPWSFAPRQQRMAETTRALHPELAGWSLEAITCAWADFAQTHSSGRVRFLALPSERNGGFITFIASRCPLAASKHDAPAAMSDEAPVQPDTRSEPIANARPDFVEEWRREFRRVNGREPLIEHKGPFIFTRGGVGEPAVKWRRSELERATNVLRKKPSQRKGRR